MRVILLSLATFLTLDVQQDIGTPATPPCNFAVTRSAQVAIVSGREEIVQRVRLLAQPDSPIVITALDLTETELVVAPGFYERTGKFALEVMNVSDRPVSDVLAEVRISHGNGHTGRGVRFSDVLMPGQRARATSGGGRGTGNGDFAADDVVVQALVEEMTVDGCTYRPSLSIPVTP